MKMCAYQDCGRPVVARALCTGHYQQQKRGVELSELTGRSKNIRPRPCGFDLCVRFAMTQGLCHTHYVQRFHGWPERPLPDAPNYRTDLFWSKVDKTGTCWNWTSHKTHGGYGHFCIGGGLRVAHRVAYEWAIGPIPAGMQLDHTCRNRGCVNPDHLRVVTNKQNSENRDGPAANNTTSAYRGVCRSPDNDKWIGQVKHNGVNHYLGRYDTEEEARVAVVAKRNELFTHNLSDRKAKQP